MSPELLPQPVRIIRRLRWESTLAAEWIAGQEVQIEQLEARLGQLEDQLRETARRLAALLDEPDAPSERSYP